MPSSWKTSVCSTDKRTARRPWHCVTLTPHLSFLFSKDIIIMEYRWICGTSGNNNISIMVTGSKDYDGYSHPINTHIRPSFWAVYYYLVIVHLWSARYMVDKNSWWAQLFLITSQNYYYTEILSSISINVPFLSKFYNRCKELKLTDAIQHPNISCHLDVVKQMWMWNNSDHAWSVTVPTLTGTVTLDRVVVLIFNVVINVAWIDNHHIQTIRSLHHIHAIR